MEIVFRVNSKEDMLVDSPIKDGINTRFNSLRLYLVNNQFNKIVVLCDEDTFNRVKVGDNFTLTI